IEEIIQHAQSEIHIMSYVLAPAAFHIVSLLEKAAERKVKVTLVINRLDLQERLVMNRLYSIEKKYPSFFRLVDFHDGNQSQLHAKVIVVDRKNAVIGSANLSWGGMVNNYEIGVYIEGPEAWTMAHLI